MIRQRLDFLNSVLLATVGTFVAAFAVWVIATWHSSAALPALPPQLERLPYDTAWALLFSGAALMAHAARRDWIGKLFAAVPIILGGLRLVAFLAPAAVRIHPILDNPWLPPIRDNYGDTSTLSALVIVVLGCALASMRPRGQVAPWRSVALAFLASIALALALLLSFGAWTGGVAVQWLQLSDGDATSSLMFLLVSGTVLGYAALGSKEEQSAVRRATPLIVWFAVFVCVLVLWRSLGAEQARFIQENTRLVSSDIKREIESEIGERVRLLARLASHGKLLDSKAWQEDAAELARDIPEFRAIGWVGPDFAAHWIVPQSDGGTLSPDIRTVPGRRDAIETAVRTRQPVLSDFTQLRVGGKETPIYVPVFDGDVFQGMLVASLGNGNWLHSILGDRFSSYRIRLLANDRVEFSIFDAEKSAGPEWTQEQGINLYNANWKVQVTPATNFLSRQGSALPGATLALGTALATLLALATYFFQTAGRRARELAGANHMLTRDIEARERAEVALRESEQRTRLIIDAIRDCAIYSLDVKGRVASWSRGARDLTGYRAQEIEGMHFAFLYPSDRHAPPSEMLTTAAERGWHEEECWHLRQDGTRFCGDDIISPIRDEEGTLQGFSVVTRDSTERIGMRQQTEHSRDFYLSLFSDFPNLVWRSDPAGACDYLNQAWLDFTGRTRETQLGHGWLEGMHPDDRQRWRSSFDRALPGQQPFEIEYRMRRADSSYGSLICSARPYHDMSGKFSGYLCSCYDNTARRATEDALKESEQRYEGITANVPGMVFKLVRDARGRDAFTYASEGGVTLTGIDMPALMADPQAFVSLISPEDRERYSASLDVSATQLSTWTWAGRFRPRDDASEKWIAIRARPRQGEDGGTVWDGVVLDDTTSHLAQLEIEHSRQELRSLSRHLQSVREEEKARIAREVHDELGATLTAFKIDLDWLCEHLPPHDKRLHEKCVAMNELVDSAVAATRKIVTDLRPSMLDDLGLAAALRWQAGEFHKHAGIPVDVISPPDDLVVDRDRGLTLFRIFQETLTNVARHAEATRIRVALSADDHAYVLEVQDDGVGVTRADLDKASSHGIRGMRERAQQLGGDVTVSNVPEGGTKMVVSLPRT